MADEIPNQNVVRVFRHGKVWLAVIGPCPGAGIVASGRTALLALARLLFALIEGGYTFDPTWTPETDA
jgi:hypothetical protein